MVPSIQTSKEQPPTEIKKEDDSCILDQLCARAQLISQHVDAGQLNIPF